MVAEIVLWVLAGIVVYVYLGYPLLITFLGRIRNPRLAVQADFTPTVSLIISAYNEEKNIAAKLENTLSLDYPEDKLEIIVASNGSTDRTDEIVRGFAPRVKLYSIPQAGKVNAQNLTVPQASGEIIIFSDANSLYERNAIRNLVRNFADPRVGVVTGRVVFGDVGTTSAARGGGLYWRYEDWVKRSEAGLGSCITGNGALLATRKELFSPVEPELQEDFMLPVRVIAQGYASLFEPEAVASEKIAQSSEEEFERKVRIIIQGSRGCLVLIRELIKHFKGFLLFQLVSHKLLRWLVPFFLIAIFGVSLSLYQATLFKWFVMAQGAFYFCAFLGYIFPKVKLLYIPYYFCLVNLASLIGIIRMLFGEKKPTWEKAESTR